ncbi:hypothetical protein CABS01_00731 [Colletotrichum abscissum]|nr:uncharacterized protein CABS01_00731 [Colletotrichum abscissum]KAK1505263.1 hypothetical protein CABS01_00731 [Colletotrichum abscissum]
MGGQRGEGEGNSPPFQSLNLRPLRVGDFLHEVNKPSTSECSNGDGPSPH